jgi:hypothetical protein
VTMPISNWSEDPAKVLSLSWSRLRSSAPCTDGHDKAENVRSPGLHLPQSQLELNIRITKQQDRTHAPLSQNCWVWSKRPHLVGFVELVHCFKANIGRFLLFGLDKMTRQSNMFKMFQALLRDGCWISVISGSVSCSEWRLLSVGSGCPARGCMQASTREHSCAPKREGVQGSGLI